MIKTNITEYKLKSGAYAAYYGRTTLKKNYEFINGDEAFYHFIGKNSAHSILDLLHPEDKEEFLKAAENLDGGRQCVILRIKNGEDEYRLMYCELTLNGKTHEGFRMVDMEISSFMELKDRHKKNMELLKKYRTFLGLSGNIFFEYNHKNDEIVLYQYCGLKSMTIAKKQLEDVKRIVGASGEFEMFYDSLKRGVERFNTSFDAGLLLDDAHGDLQVRASTMYDNGTRVMTVGILISSEAEKEKRFYLTDSALDAGTGLFNKRAIQEYAMERIQEGRTGYLAMMDVDDFKKVNDSFGHMFGDEVLSKVSEIMCSVIDSRGMVGRFGGDEFMLVLDGVSSEEELRRILKTISKNVQWEYRGIKDTLAITTSCGVAQFPKDAAGYEELFKVADKALYIAKAKGKNRFIIYDVEKHGAVDEEEVSERSIGIKSVVSDEKKASVISDLAMMLNEEGGAAFNAVMEKLRNYLDIDGIAVYAGDNLRRISSSGKYINPIESLSFIKNESYSEHFDKRGIYLERNLEKLESNYPEIHKAYQLQENREFVQCIAKRNGEIRGAVSFDYFNRAPKIGAIDEGFIKIVGRLMAEIASGLE